jgi:hypothetical protein
VKKVFTFCKLNNIRPGRRFLLASLTAGLLFHPLSAWAQFSPCDLNKDGAVNSLDVTLAVNMALGTSSCTASITGTGGCNVLMVQRVVDATLSGGTCHPTILTWTADAASNVAGYNVYRATTSGAACPTAYTKLNSAMVTGVTFTDGTSQPGKIYYYAATTLDTSGNESACSSPAVPATIPTP